MWGNDPDRYWRNESDGSVFSGYDDGDGHTSWYDSNGYLDDVTDTPSDWEQSMNDYGY